MLGIENLEPQKQSFLHIALKYRTIKLNADITIGKNK